jgi:hypothetical protein
MGDKVEKVNKAGRPRAIFNEVKEKSIKEIKKELPDEAYRTIYLAINVLKDEFLRNQKYEGKKLEACMFLVSKMGDEKFMGILNKLGDVKNKAMGEKVEFKK